MRLSILALFIALPAAAYAAVLPGSEGGQKQGSQSKPKADCTPKFNPCDDVTPCCGDFICKVTSLDSAGKPVKVCFIVHLL